MKQFSFTVTALSPLALRSDYAAVGAATAKFITGTTLTGSLAAVHRLLGRDADEFARLFLQGNIAYPHLYPASFKNEELQDSTAPVYVIPKTAQSCKRFGGFQQFEGEEESDDERHGVRDSLLDWAAFKIGSDSAEGDICMLPALEAITACPYAGEDGTSSACGAALDHLDGYYRWSEDESSRRGKADVNTRLQTRTGINRYSGTVQDGILYNREVIEEGACFQGIITVDDAVADAFQDFMVQVCDKSTLEADREEVEKDKRVGVGLLRIGTGRTRGLGKVELELTFQSEVGHEEARFTAFKERLALFDAALKARASGYGYENRLAPYYFALTLHAPVILHDEALRYRGTLAGETLAELIGLREDVEDNERAEQPQHPLKLLYHAAGIQRVAGWQELWGTPRANEYAIESGSVFLFASSIATEDSAHTTLLRRLFELEERGLGQRCAEGYGRIVISDPFHREGAMQ